MDKGLESLRTILNNANASDDEIKRGVRLTQKGYDILARKFGVTVPEIQDKIAELAKALQEPVNEDTERFSFEADVLGNVVLRDAKTGSERGLVGDEAFKLLAAIEQVGNDYQALLAPYFTLVEYAQTDEFPVEDSSIDAEVTTEGGTYNFPYQGKFATARFWSEGGKFHTKVVSLRTAGGDEYPITDAMREDLENKAFEWIDKV